MSPGLPYVKARERTFYIQNIKKFWLCFMRFLSYESKLLNTNII